MSWLRVPSTACLLPSILFVACGPSGPPGDASTGGGPTVGGGPGSGGTSSSGGAFSTGGLPSGGEVGAGGGGAVGGMPNGGSPSGGAGGSAATGGDGTVSGGASSGGASGGGDAGGGTSSGGGSTGGGPSLLFQTDFEAEAVGKVPATGNASWTTTLPTNYDSGGVVEVKSGADAHGGSKFIYVKKGNDGQAFLQLQDPKVFPFSGAKIHVRAWVKLPMWSDSHVTWLEVGSKKNNDPELRVGANLGVIDVNQWPGDADARADGKKFDANTWTCIEYSYEPAAKAFHVWLNDEPLEALSLTGMIGGATLNPPPLEAVRFGAEVNASEVYFDDIAVHTDHIGCN